MNSKTLLAIYFLFLLTSCVQPTSQPTDADTSGTPNMPNPASVYCEQQGYTLEIRTASDGSQSGVCIFSDGSECDEWAYYRRECTPATQDASLPNPASVFCEQQGYTLELRTAPDGSQGGACVFPDGSECDEWAYFRGECGPASQNPTTENKAVEAAKILLAGELNIATSQITVFSLKQMSWPDSCLGIPVQDEVCNPEVIPGFRVTLTDGAINYTYRTDLTGGNLRLETAGIQG